MVARALAAALAVALGAASGAGCFSPTYPTDLPCGEDDWCPPGQACNSASICIALEGGDGDGGTTGGDAGADAAPPPDSNGLGALLSIDIGPDITIAVDEEHQFIVTGTYELGTAQITDFAIWSSSDNNIMFVDFNGVAKGVAAGVATATCRYDGKADTAQVTVQ